MSTQNLKARNGRLSGDCSAQAHRHGGHSGQLPPNLFCSPQILLCSEKCFKHMMKTNISSS